MLEELYGTFLPFIIFTCLMIAFQFLVHSSITCNSCQVHLFVLKGTGEWASEGHVFEMSVRESLALVDGGDYWAFGPNQINMLFECFISFLLARFNEGLCEQGSYNSYERSIAHVHATRHKRILIVTLNLMSIPSVPKEAIAAIPIKVYRHFMIGYGFLFLA